MVPTLFSDFIRFSLLGPVSDGPLQFRDWKETVAKRRRDKGLGSLTQLKSGRWRGYITIPDSYDAKGRPNRKYVHGKTKREAQDKLMKLRQHVLAGSLASTEFSLASYLERWLRHKEMEIKATTITHYRYSISKYILPRLGHIALAKLRPLALQEALMNVAESAGPTTSNRCYAVLSASLKQAVRWRELPHSPMEGVTKVKETPREMTLWTSEETRRFISVAKSHRLHCFFYLLITSGCRCGELLGLQWNDVKEGSIYIRRTLYTRSGTVISTPKTKSGERRVVLPPDALSELDQHQHRQLMERELLGPAWTDTGHIFVSELGTLLNASNVTKVWHGLQERAGVPRARLHDARHLHASLLIKKGLDARTVADRLGHRDPSFTLRKYTHVFEEQRQTAAVSLDELLNRG